MTESDKPKPVYEVTAPNGAAGNDPNDYSGTPELITELADAKRIEGTGDNESPAPHPYAVYLDIDSTDTKAPEYVVDDVVTAGSVVIAGAAGVGKTSMMIPLVLVCTGLLENYPLSASVRRKVVYVAEDPDQVGRVIAALRQADMITCDSATLNDWFRVVEAKRLKAGEIAEVVPEYDDLWTPNQMIDGGEYLAPPVMVLDTTNATIHLESINDNSEVSDAIACLRQRFGRICLLLVGHITKAARNEVSQMSFVGAGAWEGDTQQTIYLAVEEGQRYLMIKKNRFSPEITEYLVRSHSREFTAIDVLGREVAIDCFYGVPEATTAEAKAEAKERAEREKKKIYQKRIENDVFQFIKNHEDCLQGDIFAGVEGNKNAKARAILSIKDLGWITIEKAEKGRGKLHRVKDGLIAPEGVYSVGQSPD
ncbi:MAG: AAA family ATPase [Halioglobus sp.]